MSNPLSWSNATMNSFYNNQTSAAYARFWSAENSCRIWAEAANWMLSLRFNDESSEAWYTEMFNSNRYYDC